MLTVLMATYNGARTLPETLEAFSKLMSPIGGWKLIIVNNGSTDATKEIISSFDQSLQLTYMFEPELGKNRALNAALPLVSGDLVVFTDDDVIPQSDWLIQIRSVSDTHPAYSIFAGSIMPKWEALPENWILSWVPLSATFGILDPVQEGPCNPRLVFGTNMAVRSAVFQKGYRFDETIGPVGTKYMTGQETEFTVRLSKAGYKAWHCKNALVYHMIRSFQMTQDWVLRKAVNFGRGEFRLEVKTSSSSIAILKEMFVNLPFQIAVQLVRVSVANWIGNAEKIFKARWGWNFLMGRSEEARFIIKEWYQSPRGIDK